MTAYINTETMEYPLHPGDIVEMTDNFVEVQETPIQRYPILKKQ